MQAGDLAEDLAFADAVVAEAGALARSMFNQGVRKWNKPGDSVVTDADMAVDALLREKLTATRPDDGWLSEEAPDDGIRLSKSRVWLIDPIDGTRSFVDGRDHWTISLGLAIDGRPALGVVFNPLRNETFVAVRGKGAERNGRALRIESPSDQGRRYQIAGPKSTIKSAGLREGSFDRTFIASLAYRFSLVAAGHYDAAFASQNASEWDVAAAHLIVEEAGGRVTSVDGAPLSFNKASPRMPAMVAAPAALSHVLVGDTAPSETGHS